MWPLLGQRNREGPICAWSPVCVSEGSQTEAECIPFRETVSSLRVGTLFTLFTEPSSFRPSAWQRWALHG